MANPYNVFKPISQYATYSPKYVAFGPAGYWKVYKQKGARGPVYWTATHRDTGATVGPFRTLRELADKIAKEI
jgi:hypothetical protein